jgi:hypothetical protein
LDQILRKEFRAYLKPRGEYDPLRLGPSWSRIQNYNDGVGAAGGIGAINRGAQRARAAVGQAAYDQDAEKDSIFQRLDRETNGAIQCTGATPPATMRNLVQHYLTAFVRKDL